jgi:hypothetical protein
MDIRTYVRQFVPPPDIRQFAVLAFDLGLEDPDAHPPALDMAKFDDKLDANSPSGPWCALPLEGWQPIKSLSPYHFETAGRIGELESGTLQVDRAGVLKKKERFNVTEWGDPEKVHAESMLMAPLPYRVERYFEKWGQLPRSISLYSYFSPCPACVDYLEQARDARKTFGGTKTRVANFKRIDVKSWFFGYDEAYLRDLVRSPLPTPSKFGLTRDGYMDASEAKRAAGKLEIAGWKVQHPE